MAAAYAAAVDDTALEASHLRISFLFYKTIVISYHALQTSARTHAYMRVCLLKCSRAALA